MKDSGALRFPALRRFSGLRNDDGKLDTKGSSYPKQGVEIRYPHPSFDVADALLGKAGALAKYRHRELLTLAFLLEKSGDTLANSSDFGLGRHRGFVCGKSIDRTPNSC
jgi:hypothetical protein